MLYYAIECAMEIDFIIYAPKHNNIPLSMLRDMP